jgi:hypothetical protein
MIDLLHILIDYVSPNDVLKISKINEKLSDYCKMYPEIIAELALKKYGVDYKDRGNLIYINKNFDDYCTENDSEDIFDLNKIYLLYLKWYNKEIIDCRDKNITSVPQLPNLRAFNCDLNLLTSLPVFPKLTHLCCTENLFETLSELHLNLESLSCSTNSPDSSPSSPRLRRLDYRVNEITSLPDFLNLDNNLDPLPDFPNLRELNYSHSDPVRPGMLLFDKKAQ